MNENDISIEDLVINNFHSQYLLNQVKGNNQIIKIVIISQLKKD